MSSPHSATRSVLLALAVLVAVAFVFSSLTSTIQQPAAASQQGIQLWLGGSHVFQSATTNSTTTAGNATGPFDFITAPVVASVKAALLPYLGHPPTVPRSTLFTIGVAVVVSLISATTGKLLVDYEMVKQNMREFQNYQKEVNKAKKENNEQALARLMKKQQAMMKLQGKASMEQMKVTAVTFVPFLLLWYTLSAVLGNVVVAVSPIPLPMLGTHLVFWQWYLLSNFAISLPTYKIFGIGISDT